MLKGPLMMHVQLQQNWLQVRFLEVHRALSWAVVGGGNYATRSVTWHQVKNSDLTVNESPYNLFTRRLNEQCLDQNTVGLLTSARLEDYTLVKRTHLDNTVICLATVGMGNVLCVGDPPISSSAFGTINILLVPSMNFSPSAQLEAVALVSEAKTLAVLQHRFASPISAQWSTGTGTDCTVVATPLGENEVPYCGKHTLWGHLIGQSVLEAVDQGIRKWKRHQDPTDQRKIGRPNEAATFFSSPR